MSTKAATTYYTTYPAAWGTNTSTATYTTSGGSIAGSGTITYGPNGPYINVATPTYSGMNIEADITEIEIKGDYAILTLGTYGNTFKLKLSLELLRKLAGATLLDALR